MSYLTQVPAFSVLTNPLDPQSNHRDVMSLFGDLDDVNPRQNAGILFRLENNASNTMLIRSSIRPENRVGSMQTIEEPAVPPAGSLVQYRLAVNAITRNSRFGKSASFPVPMDSFDDDLENTMTGFLERKLAGALKDVEVQRHNRQRLTENTKRRGRLSVQVDTIDGVATVQDGEKLAELISAGVGRAKAYGCGLLTVRKIG